MANRAESSAAEARIASQHHALDAALTDSGTSALVLALRILVGEGGTVALPGYGCIDLTAAALLARVRVRLYDLDPYTLSPDLDSLARALRRGVDAVVVAPLHGYPCDMKGVIAAASERGVPVIEDAAQAAGAQLDGASVGSFGALSVLSFGRGKGMTGGAGGALLLHDGAWAMQFHAAVERLLPATTEWRTLTVATAQWAFGRPRLYSIPSALPMLHLGEMVYRPAHEPRRLTRAAVAMLDHAARMNEAELARRREHAMELTDLARSAGVRTPALVPGGSPGYLRFVILDERGTKTAAPELGIFRGYPLTLGQHDQLQPVLHPDERYSEQLGGSQLLRGSLLTLPTHSLLTLQDRQLLASWLSDERGRLAMPVRVTVLT
ncbi:MAG TPA: DegT/DnrJ/EryC1/StrS family aminotransferase [Gemmatimonadaceae bacterium]|nr:DegT/DnrJ/EryC1/StrS family aminotransferase [Gemmatimonadaceae bacterium]